MNGGLIIAAPSSGSGKTTITLGLLRAFYRVGQAVRGAKSGPDYIDSRFHAAACAAPCYNLDAWAMTPERIQSLTQGPGLLIVEGAMGLFDGAPPMGKGATADLARLLHLPVVLVVDAAKMAQSIAPLVAGFSTYDPNVSVAGVILNKVGSARHETMLRRALTPLGIPVLGAIHRQASIHQPSRHLGLVQAGEHPELEHFLDTAADVVQQGIDLDALLAMAHPLPKSPPVKMPPPPAQKIAIAQDAAFAFAYPHLLQDWKDQGAELTFFSPLSDQPPAPADLVFLPGGYPELHAAQLSNAVNFHAGMHKAAASAQIYGECGGYMTLGQSLTDADGKTHSMLGLLPLDTSFASRKLHLGYRHLKPRGGPFKAEMLGHEFHYATTKTASGPALFDAQDAEGTSLPAMGIIHENVCGSFAHVIDRAV